MVGNPPTSRNDSLGVVVGVIEGGGWMEKGPQRVIMTRWGVLEAASRVEGVGYPPTSRYDSLVVVWRR